MSQRTNHFSITEKIRLLPARGLLQLRNNLLLALVLVLLITNGGAG